MAYPRWKAINWEKPDLLFLDVHMPGLTGLEVLGELEGAKMPVTIFVTAHKDYAIEAFEANAVDYILKPFGSERVERSVARAKVRLASSLDDSYASQLLQALAVVQRQQQYQERIAVPVNGRVLLVDTKDIYWVEAEKKLRSPPRWKAYLRTAQHPLQPGIQIEPQAIRTHPSVHAGEYFKSQRNPSLVPRPP